MLKSENKVLSEIDFTQTLIDEIIIWLKTNELPKHVQSHEQHEMWAKHFSEFETRNNQLFYNKKRVIPSDDKTAIRDAIKGVYDSPEGLGKGINQLSIFIHNKFIGIRRVDVTNFLKLQPDYQMAASHPRVVSRPVQVTAPFQTYAIDLVDMSFYNGIKANKNYNWIFSCLDMFSRYCYLVPLKQKTALNVKSALESVLALNHHKFDTPEVKSKLPSVVWSDNGTEFLGEVSTFLKENGSKQIYNKAYVPVADIENLNLQVRNHLRHLFIKQKSLDWLTHLQDIATSINSNYNAKLHTTPLDMMLKYFNGETDALNKVSEHRKALSDAKFSKFYRQDSLKLGDHVRCKLSSLYTSLRSRIKAGTAKLNIVQFSPEIYKIGMVYPPPTGQIGYNSYLLQDRNEKFIIDPKKGAPQRFRFNELQHVPSGLTINSGMTQQQADHLNQVKQSSDVVEQEPEVVEMKAVKIAKPPVPFSEWKGKEWTQALKSNLYSFENNRFEILKVEYDRKQKLYIVISADFRDVVQGKLVKKAPTFEINLPFLLNICKNELWFTGDMQAYIDQHLPQEEKEIEKPLEIQNHEPEEMNQPLQQRELNLDENSKTKRNLFSMSGGSIYQIGHRVFRMY
jgi:hypothetical protein